MQKGELIYEGKAKKLYITDDPDVLLQEFKDDATAFNAQKRGTILGKGAMNNQISARLFQMLEKEGIKTHFVKLISDCGMLVKKVQIIPLEVTIRNIIAGGMAKMLGIEEGMLLKKAVFEWHYKSDALGDPLINDDHILSMNMATERELGFIRSASFKINTYLIQYFKERKLDLVDFKLEFGRFQNGHILLADEISPDTMRLWEEGTKKKLDKDRFRRDLGGVEDAYQEVLRRVMDVR